jgi:transcriptional regulator with XRE-family HTH domain
MDNVIGRNIRAHRERLSWTQDQLAAAADVSLRTVQRAEEGQIIAAESLQALAGALDVTQEVLRTDLDAVALEAALKETKSRYKLIPLQRVERGSDVRQFMPADAYQVDRVDVADEAAEDTIALLEQQLKDLGDLWRDMEPVQRHEALKDVQQEIDALRSLGFVVTAGVDQMRLRPQHSEEAFTMNVLHVVVAPASEPKLFAMRDKTTQVSFT